MKRILVLGSAGAGKSTITTELGKITGLPIIRLDAEYWKPGWLRPEREEWKKRVEKLIQKKEWIMDGNYQSTLKLRVPSADTIIFMDIPRLICLWRILKRHLKMPKREVTPGCVEKIDLEFINYIRNFPKRKRPEIMEILEKYKNEKQIHIIRSEKQMWKFLKSISKTRQTHFRPPSSNNSRS